MTEEDEAHQIELRDARCRAAVTRYRETPCGPECANGCDLLNHIVPMTSDLASPSSTMSSTSTQPQTAREFLANRKMNDLLNAMDRDLEPIVDWSKFAKGFFDAFAVPEQQMGWWYRYPMSWWHRFLKYMNEKTNDRPWGM